MITLSKLNGLLAMAVMFSAGIHAALVPEHLEEMPPLGYLFIVAAAIGAAIACGLVTRRDDVRIQLLAVLFLAGQVLAWVLFVTVHVPGFSGTPEGIETIALVSKAVELIGISIGAPLLLAAAGRSLRSVGGSEYGANAEASSIGTAVR